MGITDIALKLAAPLPGLENYKRYLFIGPHPDDIEIGAGATAAKLIKEGKEVCFLICTDGRFGTVNAPEGLTSDALAALREKEALASAAMLGVQDVRFLRFCDGGFYEYALSFVLVIAMRFFEINCRHKIIKQDYLYAVLHNH